MRIDGMDAGARSAEYVGERVRIAPEPVQKPPVAEVKQPVPAEAPAVKGDDRLVRMAVDKANRQMANREVSLQFEAHDVMNEMIVRIIDTNTKEVIREIPSKKILDMVANMLEMAGLLVDEKG